jgi:hypothetical protein
MKRAKGQPETVSTKKKPRTGIATNYLSELDTYRCQWILSFCDFRTIALCCSASKRFKSLISEAFVKKLYQSNTGIPTIVVDKSFKSVSHCLENLHWIQGFNHFNEETIPETISQLVQYPLDVDPDPDLSVSIHNSLDITDDSIIVACPVSGEDFEIIGSPDISSKCPAVVRDVESMEVLGYVPYQECFASSVFTSPKLGKFLITAKGRSFFATHIEKNLYTDLKDLAGVFQTDVKKKLIYTHPTELECFSINNGFFTFNDKIAGYSAELTDAVLDPRSKVKISEPFKYDPKSAGPLLLSDYDPYLGIFVCSGDKGNIYIWYDMTNPTVFETIEFQWKSEENVHLESLDFILSSGYLYVTCSTGQYSLLKWSKEDGKFKMSAEGRDEWAPKAIGEEEFIEVCVDFADGRLLMLDFKRLEIRIKNLNDLNSPVICWDIALHIDTNDYDIWWARVAVSNQPRRIFVFLNNGDIIVWNIKELWKHCKIDQKIQHNE